MRDAGAVLRGSGHGRGRALPLAADHQPPRQRPPGAGPGLGDGEDPGGGRGVYRGQRVRRLLRGLVLA